MLISFFSKNDFTTGVDYSEHPDILYQEDLDFNPEKQIAELVENEGVFSIKISEKPIPEDIETEAEKRERLFEAFLKTKDIENFDWEGYELNKDDYNNLIILRDFDGDAGAQIALLTKTHFKHIAMFYSLGVPKEKIFAVYKEEIEMIEKVSKTRVLLGLQPFDMSFLKQ